MTNWIFQDIKDIKKNVLYANMSKGKTLAQSTSLYNEALRENVKPETYVRYLMWQADIYVDVEMIRVVTQHIYPEITTAQIDAWVVKHKEPHHILTR